MAALVLALGTASASAGRKRLVVLEFDGPNAEKFHEGVVKLIKKNHTVLGVDKWNSAAEELGADAVTDKNIKKIAKKLKIDGVVTGKIEKRRESYIIRIKLREGSSGAISGSAVQTQSEAPRLDAQSQRDLKDELLPAIDELAANHGGDDGDDEEEKPAKKKKPVDEEEEEAPAKKSGFSRKSKVEDEEEKPSKKKMAKEEDEEEKPAKKKKAKEDEEEKPSKKKMAKEEDEEEKPAKKPGGAGVLPGKKRGKEDDEEKPSKKKKGDDEEKTLLATKRDKGEDDEDKPTKKRKSEADDEDTDKKSASADDEEKDTGEVEEEPKNHAGDKAKRLSPAYRAIDAVIGMSFVRRNLTFDYESTLGNPPHGYKQTVPVPGAMVDITAYPLAVGHKNKSMTANLGLNVLFDQVIYINSQKRATINGMQQTVNLATAENRWSVGAVFRYPLGKDANATVVGGKLSYGGQKFTVAQTLPGSMESTDIPNVHYTMVSPEAFIQYPISSKLIANGDLAFHAVMGTGEINQPDQYGGGSVTGFEFGASLDYNLTPNIFIRAGVRIETFGFKFNDNAMSKTNMRDADPEQDVMGARDTYMGAAATLGYLY